MAGEKKTTSATTKTAKKTTGKVTTSKSVSSKNADAERARKEALREEVLALYSKKQNGRDTRKNADDKDATIDEVAEEASANEKMPSETIAPMKNAYTTPFFGTNKAEGETVTPRGVKEDYQEMQTSSTKPEAEDNASVNKIGSFEEFSKNNYGNDSLSGFDGGNYVGLSQKPQKTKIISEKKYDRSPRFEKFKKFVSYLFTTKEGWYYILGTLCLIFIIVLFFI